MKPRERVLRAFKRMPGLPDRVPVQFEFCAQLYDHFSRKLGIPLRYTRNLFEDFDKIDILGAGGGYMISPAHIIQNDVSPERVEKFIELCRRHGAYA